MDFLPDIGPLDSTKSKWVWYYLMAGLGTWLFLQYFYVESGRAYWTGFATGDPMSTGSQLSTQVQQVVLWPIAILKTISMTGAAGAPQ